VWKTPGARKRWCKPGKVTIVRTPVQKFVASVLIAFMLNTVTWGVSAGAFADWVATEQVAQQSDDAGGNAPDTGLPDNCGDHCDQGCQVFSHLHGLVQTALVYLPTLDAFVVPGSLNSPGDRSPDGLFRPPRSSVPACPSSRFI
jgi:hypothetical protein